MREKLIKISPKDNLLVALADIKAGESVTYQNETYLVKNGVQVKHKIAECDFQEGDVVVMYGLPVGKATTFIAKGEVITTKNVIHHTGGFSSEASEYKWTAPDVSDFKDRTFKGYKRKDGKVGTANYWLVIPLVFCQNRNIKVLQEELESQLGYKHKTSHKINLDVLKEASAKGASAEEILKMDVLNLNSEKQFSPFFPNVDGIRFLTHEGGCGGTREDAIVLSKLLAGYIANANVAGATILGLGCQNAEVKYINGFLEEFGVLGKKPVHILEQQQSTSERNFIAEAVKLTFAGLMEANEFKREDTPLSELLIGLECGGSDGFSGISANPLLGYVSDMIVTLGGGALLSEFPELNGVEQNIVDRCIKTEDAEKFSNLIKTYAQRAVEAGSGFEANPSPGNIKDGLITDAMKSAGAALKGGASPIVDVLDYTEVVSKKGLSLLCTPGNDVESTTGLAGSGANVILFSTGLGTPTGNPAVPVVKVSSNTVLAEKMSDIIDFNAGTIVTGEHTIREKAIELLELIIKVASGEEMVKAENLRQFDFIPWKRGVSL
ncbi:UxaA family hydrolase [Labilibaculum antarcticum]|uniref:Altronate hydrolase n=1 Tax=Labilibaculum antarcticum TaxID=1717717 RepID=A0A1Y1CDT9_9BACT|nr:altronate dehydratase family protein [Labilibaculum antarcticum]BAX78495.1 altronate hydrolase [Labilibaculum antarcticum]